VSACQFFDKEVALGSFYFRRPASAFAALRRDKTTRQWVLADEPKPGLPIKLNRT